MIYNFHSNNYRAEIFTKLAVGFVSFFGIALIRILIFQEPIDNFLNFGGAFIIFFLLIGIALVLKSFAIYEYLDRVEEKELSKNE